MTSRSGTTADLRVGLRVLTGAGFTKKGEIKFIGTTQFASGEWIGVLLDQPEGKNDGTVNDVKYFEADSNCGLFVRRVQVKVDNEVKSASASTRERLSLLKEKRSSMLRDTGGGSGIPSLKPTSSSSNLSCTGASVNSTGSGGSQATPAVGRTTRRSSLAPPTSRTSPPPPPAASVAPKKSRLSVANPVPQTPIAPARTTQSFSTPTATADSAHIAPAAAPAAVQTQSEENTPIEEPAVDEKEQQGSDKEEQEEEEEAVQEYVDEGEVEARRERFQHQQPCQSRAPSPEAEDTPVLEQESEHVQSEQSGPTVSPALQTESSTAQETAQPVETDKAMEQPEPIGVTPVKTALPQQETSTSEVPASAASESAPAMTSMPAATPSTPVPATLLSTPKHPAPSTPAAGTGHYVTPLRDATVRRVPSSRTPAVSGDSAAATPSKDAALIQFMQTSIYKLTKEKDDLAEKVAQLTSEVQDLNTHLGQSNDLTTSVQDDMERVVTEREELQVQLTAVQAQMAATQTRSDLETATLRDRIKKLENAPPPKDPRVGELERQLADLNSMVESLTLDKEQLAVEQELLDEKYLQAQIDLEEALAEVQTLTSLNEAQTAAAAAHSGSGVTEADEGGALALASLKAENEKLREALRRLNSSSAQDKQALAVQTPRLAALEVEVAELKTYKAQAEGDLAALRATVDSVASFEEMIETLSDKNMELAEQLAEAKEAVRDLEDTAELNEEIDQQQRKQIEADRSTIDMLTVSLSSFEQRLADKDRALAEQATAASRIKAANLTLKAEVQRINALLSSGSQESKQLEAKLRELAYLRANQDVLTAELHAAQQAHLTTSARKHKFQALFTRVDAIFGGTAVFIEESKQINTEIAFVSATATGLEACRSLSAVLDVVLQTRAAEGGGTVTALDWDILPTLDSGGPSAARVVPTLGKLYALVLQAQAYSVQCNLDLFRPASSDINRNTAPSPRIVQRLIDLKARFEAVAQISRRLKSVCGAIAQEWRTHTASTAMSRAVVEAGNEGETDLSVLAEQDEGLVFLPSEGSTQGLCLLLHEVAALVTDLTNLMDPSLASTDALNILQNCTLLSSCVEVNPSLQVELLLTSINVLSDMALQQVESPTTVDSAEDGAVVATLRSMKIDVKAAVLNLKSHSAHYASQLPELVGNYQMLMSCFADAAQAGLLLDADAESTAQRVGLVQNFLRRLNSTPGLSSSVSSTQQLMLGTSGVMRFLPLTLLTNIVPLADTALCGRMLEQHEHYVERYWMLTTQTHSDLLLIPAGSVAASSTGGTSTYTEVSWRARVAESRSLILAKFDSVGAHSLETEGVELNQGVKSDSPVKAPAAQARVQALLAELDIKKDELRVAMQRCEELQTQLDTATADEGTKKAGNRSLKSTSSKTASELQEEIATLEEALFATEEKVEALEAEGKALKAQLGATGPRGDAALREGDQPGAVSFDFKASGLLRKKAGQHAGGVPTAQFQAVLDQSLYWKQLALRRLTESLMPLVPLPVSTATTVSAVDADEHAQPKNASQLPPGLTFKHVELVAAGRGGGFAAHEGAPAAPACAADYAAIYHKLRLARASATRIKSISAESDAKRTTARTGSARSRSSMLLYKISL